MVLNDNYTQSSAAAEVLVKISGHKNTHRQK